MSERVLFGTFLYICMRAETVNARLYIGVLHQRDEDDDFVDVKFITLSKEVAENELIQIKIYGVKTLKLKCVVDRENYILYKSLDERSVLEAFVVERILVVKKNGN